MVGEKRYQWTATLAKKATAPKLGKIRNPGRSAKHSGYFLPWALVSKTCQDLRARYKAPNLPRGRIWQEPPPTHTHTNLVPPKSYILGVQSHLTLCDPMDYSPTSLLCPWDFPGKNTPMQGIFLTQGWNPHLLQWQADSLPLCHLGSPVWYKHQLKK